MTASSLRHHRLGAVAVSIITAVVGWSWLRWVNLPFGDNHSGNVAARYALHVRNLYSDGLLGSNFGANWGPYHAEPYAHHPPLLNILDAAIGLLPGDGPFQIRLAPLLLALVAIPAAAVLLRQLGIGWTATLLSVAAFASTGYYWIYGQVMFDIGPILFLAAGVTHLLATRRPSTFAVAATTVGAAASMLASWPGIAFGAVMIATLGIARRDRIAAVVAAAGAVGLVVTLAFMFGVQGLGALADQTEFRTKGGSFTRAEFFDQIDRYMDQLLPWWYRWLLPAAIVVGLFDRRTRPYVAVATSFAFAWVVVLNNGAYIHDYWGYLVILPGLVGGAALVDRFVAGEAP